MNIMALSSVVLNIVLNYVLIPDHGALGATVATVITQFLATIAQALICIAVFKFVPRWDLLLTAVTFVGICVGSFWIAAWVDVDWWIALCAAGAVSLVAAVLLRMIDLRGLRGGLE
jgi:O-antigen/teichoic acid export membrane protein